MAPFPSSATWSNSATPAVRPGTESSPTPALSVPEKGCGDSPPTSVKRTDLEPVVEYQVVVQALSGDGYGD